MESLKRMFRSMFKRNKKPSKQDQEKPTVNTSTRQLQTPSAVDRAPPQLPPIQNNSPLQSATETSKPLPPTHPLSTGTHSKPQEAVPQNHKAQPGPPAPVPKVATRPEVAETVKEEEKKPKGATKPEPSPVNESTKSEAPVVETDSTPPPPPPKNDSAIEQAKPETPAVADLPATESAKEPAKENVPPKNTTTEEKPTTNGTAAIDEKSTESSPTQDDGKMLAMEDPPPVKTVGAAPGMSATSGPLEDFPEGGDMIED